VKHIEKIQKTISWLELVGLSTVFVLVGEAHLSYQREVSKEQLMGLNIPTCYYQCPIPHRGWNEVQVPLAVATTGTNTDISVSFIAPPVL